jgi:hypothetical protein
MQVAIPVKPYVKRFLVKEFGKEPIRVRANSDLGAVMLLSFQHGEHIAIDDINLYDSEDFRHDASKMSSVTFELGCSFERGASIVPDRMVKLTGALMANFRQSLYYFCVGRRTLFNSELASVKLFLKMYDIPEDELSEDTAIKMAQRERRERVNFRMKRTDPAPMAIKCA